MNITIYSTHAFDQPYLTAANQEHHRIHFVKEVLSLETVSLCKGSEAIALFSSDLANAEILEQLHRQGIKYISLRSVGYNHVDLEKARQLKIRVANVPSYSPYSIAEHAVALMMALNRKLVSADQKIKSFNFSIDDLVGFDMNGKTIGIVGVGNIGKVMSKILHGFGCQLLGYDLEEDEDIKERYGLKYTSLHHLCEQSDIISLHLPLNESTQYIIQKAEIDLMKEGVMLINTGRGALFNTKEVLTALTEKKIGALGMDVYEYEQDLFFEDHSQQQFLEDDLVSRLMTFKNVLITSHQAFLTETALSNIADSSFYNLNCFESQETCKNELT